MNWAKAVLNINIHFLSRSKSICLHVQETLIYYVIFSVVSGAEPSQFNWTREKPIRKPPKDRVQPESVGADESATSDLVSILCHIISLILLQEILKILHLI